MILKGGRCSARVWSSERKMGFRENLGGNVEFFEEKKQRQLRSFVSLQYIKGKEREGTHVFFPNPSSDPCPCCPPDDLSVCSIEWLVFFFLGTWLAKPFLKTDSTNLNFCGQIIDYLTTVKCSLNKFHVPFF